MPKIRITVKKKSKVRSRKKSVTYERLTPEKRRKIEDLMLARQSREQADRILKEEVHERKEAAPKPSGEPSISRKKRDRACRTIIEWGIIGLLIFSPLPAASVHEWSILVIQLTVFALFGVYLLMREKPGLNTHLGASLKWPRYMFAALFVLIFAQLFPLPKFLVNIFSHHTYAFRSLFSPLFADTVFMGLSTVPAHTFRQGMELLAYFLLGFLVIHTVTSYRQIMRIVYVLLGMSVFQALYGFFELYSRNPRILFYKKTYTLDAVTGTFINRNHFSGYLEMIVPIALGVVLARSDIFRMPGLTVKEKILQFLGKGLYIRILVPVSIIVISLAIIFSKSRSGIFLLILTFILFFELYVLYFRKSGKKKRTESRFLKLMFLLIIIFALYIGIEGVIERFSLERFLSESRPTYWAQTVDIIKDFPVFGSGLGTFGAVYPAYDKYMIPAQFSHAHNDYLEYFSELGFVGLFVLMAGILSLLIKSYSVWRERSHPQMKALALGGIIAIIVLLLHSITDFNLHIPANMLLFSTLLSLTVVMAFYKIGEDEGSGRADGKIQVRERGGCEPEEGHYSQEVKEWQKFISERKQSGSKKGILLGIIVLLSAASVAIYWNHNLYNEGKATETHAQKIRVLQRANAIYPKNDFVYHEMGLSNYAQGHRNSEFEEVRIARLEDSVDNFESALGINPFSAYSHYFLAKSLESLSSFTPRTQKEKAELGEASSSDTASRRLKARASEEYKNAVRLAAHHKEIYIEVGKNFFSRWNELSSEDKDFTVDFLKKLSGHIQIEELIGLMHFWAMEVRDYSIMNIILPDGIQAYKMYVELLGENSLSSEERRRYQAKVEAIRFQSARKQFKDGENALVYRKIEEACDRFARCLDILGSVKFYQNLTGEKVIDPDEYRGLKKSSCLQLAKCRLLTGHSYADVEKYLQMYVQMEEREAALHELEIFLRNQGVFGEKIEFSLGAISLCAFQMELYFKQGRYREIIDVSRNLDMDYRILPESRRKIYAKLMHVVGNAFLKQDFLYDASAYYMKALDINPENLDLLLKLRTSYERYNDERMTRQLNEMISQALSPKEQLFEDSPVQKEKYFSHMMGFDGARIVLRLNIKGNDESVKPLVSVFFNNMIVWENYVAEDGIVSLPLKPVAGQNRLVVSPINTDIAIQSITYH